MRDVLPEGVLFQSTSASQGSYDHNTGIWTVGALNGGASANLTITVKVDVHLINGVSWNLGIASEYNAFILYDIYQPSSDVEGKMAVGRNAFFANYSHGALLQPNSGDVLVVGKNLTY